MAEEVAAEVQADEEQARREEAALTKREASAKVKRERAAAMATVAASQRCGPTPFKPHWIAKNFLRERAHDPDSIEIVSCDQPVITPRGWEWSCATRGKNMLGARILTKVDMRSCGDQVWGR